jgi:hypothetical protein
LSTTKTYEALERDITNIVAVTQSLNSNYSKLQSSLANANIKDLSTDELLSMLAIIHEGLSQLHKLEGQSLVALTFDFVNNKPIVTQTTPDDNVIPFKRD